MQYVDKSILEEVYQERDTWSHKGQFGKLLVIAGSEKHTGSPIFVGMAAYRAGCDLVFLIGPERAMDVAANYSPLLITQPLKGKQLEKKHISEILSMADEVRASAIAIGPGLWRVQKTREAIIKLIERIDLPMVIDADAIRAVSARKDILKGKDVILTPHDNEFLELTGIKVSRKNLKERIESVEKQAAAIKVILVLKGNVDIISDGEMTKLNKSGSPKMTVGGMGDTLTGICGALLARRIDSFTSACASAYINGVAGELAVKKFGGGTVTTDLLDQIASVIL